MTLLSHPIDPEFGVVTQFKMAGDAIDALPAGNQLHVVVNSASLATKTEEIPPGSGEFHDFVEVPLSLPTEIGQRVKLGVQGPNDLWVNGSLKNDTAPLGLPIKAIPGVIHSVELVAESLTDWVIDRTGVGSVSINGAAVEVDTLATVTGRGNTTANDIEITSTATGVIMPKPDGTRMRLQLDDDGALVSTNA